jgi:hypothetical protein
MLAYINAANSFALPLENPIFDLTRPVALNASIEVGRLSKELTN